MQLPYRHYTTSVKVIWGVGNQQAEYGFKLSSNLSYIDSHPVLLYYIWLPCIGVNP